MKFIIFFSVAVVTLLATGIAARPAEIELEDVSEDSLKRLQEKAQKLDEKIKEDIKDIESQGHHNFTGNLVKIEKAVAELVKNISSFHNMTDDAHFTWLQAELVFLGGAYVAERSAVFLTVEDIKHLEEKADRLLKQVKKDIELLKQKDMDIEAEHLQREADRIEELAKKLKTDEPIRDARKEALVLRAIEFDIARLMRKYEREMKKHKGDHHDHIEIEVGEINENALKHLQTNVQKLHQKIQEDIKNLESQGHSNFTENLHKIEKSVAKLENEVSSFQNMSNVAHFALMEAELVFLGGAYVAERSAVMLTVQDIKHLEEKADRLLKQIKRDMDLLHKYEMEKEADQLKEKADHLEELAKELKTDEPINTARHQAMVLRGIEFEVAQMMRKFEREIKKREHGHDHHF